MVVVVLAPLGGVLVSCMEKPVCGTEALFYQFWCSNHCHLGSVGWQSIPVVSVCFPDEYYGEL